MTFDEDTRGQAIQIGAMILFAFLILAATGYQSGIIPDQNSEVEFNHNQGVQAEMLELRNAMMAAEGRESARDVRLTLGTEYPDRTLFVNPGDPVGSLETTAGENQGIVFEDVDVDGGDAFESQRVEYQPGYNEYDEAPTTVVEHGFVYNDHGDTVTPLADHQLVENGELSLMIVEGDLSESAESLRVAVESPSTETRTTEVQPESEDARIELQTELSEEQATELVDLGSDSFDFEVDPDGPNSLIVDLNEDRETYDLEITRVALDEEIEPADPAYLSEVDRDDDVAVELRDEFGTPIEGEDVGLSVQDGDGELIGADGDVLDGEPLETDGEGRVTANYQPAEDEEGEVLIAAEAAEAEDVDLEFQITIPDPLDGEVGAPDDDGEVQWTDTSVATDPDEEFMVTAENEFGDRPLDLAVENAEVLDIVDSPDTFDDGEADVTFEIDGDEAEASGDESWYAYVFDQGSGDRLLIELLDRVGVIWETQADWADADEQDGVIHETFGDRQDDAIQLGYEGTDDGLVGYWPLDEETGTVAEDVSGTGNDGDHVDSPVIGADGLLGTTSYEFDGEGGHVEVPHDASLEMSDTDAVTVSTWVNKESIQGDEDWVALAQKSDASYNLQLENGNEPAFTIHDGDWQTTNSDVELDTDRWYHVVGTYDGEEARIYVDGELEGTESVSGTISDASDFDVGIGENLDQTDRHFDGRIDEVRLYDRALDTDEVESLGEITEGSYTSGWKTSEEVLDLNHLRLEGVDADHNGGYISVIVEARQEDDTVLTSESIVLDGSSTYDVEGFDPETSAEEFRLNVVMTSPNIEQSPVLSRVEIVSEAEDVGEAEFMISEFDAPAEVVEGETVTASASIENEGNLEGTEDVEYVFNGSVEDSTEETLDAGESTTVAFEYELDMSADEYEHRIQSELDDAGDEITVLEPATFDVSLSDIEDPVAESETGTVEADISNVGELSGSQTIELRYDENDDGTADETADTETVSDLEPEVETSVILEWEAEPEGETAIVVSSDDDTTADSVSVACNPEESDCEDTDGDVIVGEDDEVSSGDSDIDVGGNVSNNGEFFSEDGDINVGGNISNDGEFSSEDGDINVGGDLTGTDESVLESEDGDVEIGAGVRLTGSSELASEDGDVTIGDDVELTDSSLHTEDGDIVIDGDLTLDGESEVSGEGDLDVTGDLTIVDTSEVTMDDGDVEVGGELNVEDDGDISAEEIDVEGDDNR